MDCCRLSLIGSRNWLQRNQVSNTASDFGSQQRWNRIANLVKLFGPAPLEEIVVGKRLQPGGFSYRQASALFGGGMDEVMTIL